MPRLIREDDSCPWQRRCGPRQDLALLPQHLICAPALAIACNPLLHGRSWRSPRSAGSCRQLPNAWPEQLGSTASCFGEYAQARDIKLMARKEHATSRFACSMSTSLMRRFPSGQNRPRVHPGQAVRDSEPGGCELHPLLIPMRKRLDLATCPVCNPESLQPCLRRPTLRPTRSSHECAELLALLAHKHAGQEASTYRHDRSIMRLPARLW